jgi:hypothetical protein
MMPLYQQTYYIMQLLYTFDNKIFKRMTVLLYLHFLNIMV